MSGLFLKGIVVNAPRMCGLPEHWKLLQINCKSLQITTNQPKIWWFNWGLTKVTIDPTGCRRLGEKPVGRIIFWATDDWATTVI